MDCLLNTGQGRLMAPTGSCTAEADCYGERRDSLLWEPELPPKVGHANVILKDLTPAFAGLCV